MCLSCTRASQSVSNPIDRLNTSFRADRLHAREKNDGRVRVLLCLVARWLIVFGRSRRRIDDAGELNSMDIQDLRIFCRLAAVGNLSTVGPEFNLTAGTISKRLQAMESELRVRLFARTTRSIRITQEGEIFLGRAQKILAEFDAGISALGNNAVSPRGRIRIASPAYLAGRHISEALGAFLKAFPDVDTELEVTDRPVNLHDEGFDAAIVSGAKEDDSIKARRLCRDPQVLVASPAYIARHGTPKNPQQLEFHACLVHGGVRQWSFERSGERELVRIRSRISSNDCETTKAAAIAGLGIARFSAARVSAEIKSGQLNTVLGAYDASPDSTLWAVCSASTHLPARLIAFLDFMADWLADGSDTRAAVGLPNQITLPPQRRSNPGPATAQP